MVAGVVLEPDPGRAVVRVGEAPRESFYVLVVVELELLRAVYKVFRHCPASAGW